MLSCCPRPMGCSAKLAAEQGLCQVPSTGNGDPASLQEGQEDTREAVPGLRLPQPMVKPGIASGGPWEAPHRLRQPGAEQGGREKPGCGKGNKPLSLCWDHCGASLRSGARTKQANFSPEDTAWCRSELTHPCPSEQTLPGRNSSKPRHRNAGKPPPDPSTNPGTCKCTVTSSTGRSWR